MKLRAIVATAATEQEAIAIFAEVAKTHAFIEFHKIDDRQVTIVYEPEQERIDRLNREAQAEQTEKQATENCLITFKVGKTYSARISGDSGIKVTFKILKRSGSFVTLETGKRCKIYKNNGGVEFCYPEGQHSQCLILKADKIETQPELSDLQINPSQPIDIQKICPHCDRPLEKGETCCVYSLNTDKTADRALVGKAYESGACDTENKSDLPTEALTKQKRSFVQYKASDFTYTCDGNEIIITREDKGIEIARYTCESEEIAYKKAELMAKIQKKQDRAMLKEQKLMATLRQSKAA